jgi:hypothetical protein
MQCKRCSFCQAPTNYADDFFEVGCMACTKAIHEALGRDTGWIDNYNADYMTFDRKVKGCQWYLDGWEKVRQKRDLCSQCGKRH